MSQNLRTCGFEKNTSTVRKQYRTIVLGAAQFRSPRADGLLDMTIVFFVYSSVATVG